MISKKLAIISSLAAIFLQAIIYYVLTEFVLLPNERHKAFDIGYSCALMDVVSNNQLAPITTYKLGGHDYTKAQIDSVIERNKP